MNEYEFEVNRGSVVDGKPEWPDVLLIAMSKRQALDLIGQLARMVNDGEDVAVQFVGTLTTNAKVQADGALAPVEPGTQS